VKINALQDLKKVRQKLAQAHAQAQAEAAAEALAARQREAESNLFVRAVGVVRTGKFSWTAPVQPRLRTNTTRTTQRCCAIA
jgi:hypothetical protein